MSENKFENAIFKISSECSPDSQTGCVGVAIGDQEVAVRDTKDGRPIFLVFNDHEWKAFIAGVKRGEFDL